MPYQPAARGVAAKVQYPIATMPAFAGQQVANLVVIEVDTQRFQPSHRSRGRSGQPLDGLAVVVAGACR